MQGFYQLSAAQSIVQETKSHATRKMAEARTLVELGSNLLTLIER